jgi:3,4-dihydroxy 2-butanone 4-phosphate synthase/GTP cyclohydrolase II
VPQLEEYCARHGLKMISVAQLIRYRMRHERIVRRVGEGLLKTEHGEFRTIAYGSTVDAEQHLALIFGDVADKQDVLVRMHSHCTYGDVFGSTECECSRMMRQSLAQIARQGEGVLVYLHQTGIGLGLRDGRLIPHSREFLHYKTPEGQRQLQHEVGIGAQILADLGLHTIRLLTNHPRKIVALEAFGIEIVGQLPVEESR